MTTLKTPYNFVPLSPFVLYPEWAPLASHDHPFEDGLSGELAISLTTHTPLCVGGQQKEASANEAGKVFFYTTPDGTPAIPGSSLKGALRNVLSIAAFGSMNQLEPTFLYKKYHYYVHDYLSNTNGAHTADPRADLPELLFGRIKNEDTGYEWGLRGRVNIGHMTPVGKKSPTTAFSKPVILAAPKPSFDPTYLKQTPGTKAPSTWLEDEHAQLRGWKRYPVKPIKLKTIREIPEPLRNKKQLQVKLETVPPETRFEGRIRFHNLLPVELGALLWTLDFGNRSHLAHAMGIGKPYGLGQVTIKPHPQQCTIIANQPEVLKKVSNSHILNESRKIFKNYMNDVWQSVTNETKRNWEECPQVDHLLAMANPTKGAEQLDQLKYMDKIKDFSKVRNKKEVLALYGKTSEEVDWAIDFYQELKTCSLPINNSNLFKAEE